MSHSQPAVWPQNSEIFTHLHHTPWIFLPFAFDADACLQEGMRLLDRFVVHRQDSQSPQGAGRWKSLAIRASGGNSAATEAGESAPLLTDIAHECPATMRMLESLTDLNSCGRIRFMLLEPGAEISVHSDAPEKTHSLAVNIALNMPEECEFWVDLNPDGSPNPYSRRIPIQAGQAFLFNTSTYHRVVNRSAVPRIHIILHGPLRISDEAILRSAREQNGRDGHAAVRALVEKKLRLGEAVSRSSALFSDWRYATNLSVLPEEIAVGVFTEPLGDPLMEEESLRLTRASLFPMKAEFFPVDFLEDWLRKKAQKGANFAVVMAAGNFIHSPKVLSVEIMRALAEMEESTLCGHLMNRSDRLPYLHEQFFLLNLRNWSKEELPPFGSVDKRGGVSFPAFTASAENVHSDYTPLWLEKKPGAEEISGVAGFGTELLASLLRRGERVKNVPLGVRHEKKYAYPRSGRAENYVRVTEVVRKTIVEDERLVFPFNTERLRVRDYKLRPTTIIFPCAGLKPFVICRQLAGGANTRFVFAERNALALKHFEQLLACGSLEEVLRVVEGTLARQNGLPKDEANYAAKQMQSVLAEGFGGDAEEFLRCLRRVAQNATLHEIDYHSDHDQLAALASPGEPLFFWHSNAWETRTSLLKFSPADLRRNYRRLAEKFSARLGAPAWVHKTTFEVIFGASVDAPLAVLTAGGGRVEPHKPQSYELLSGEHQDGIISVTRVKPANPAMNATC